MDHLSVFELNIFSNLIFIFKQQNIPFKYLLTITTTAFMKNSNYNVKIDLNKSIYFRRMLLYNQFNLISGLNKFFSDFLLFLLLKKQKKSTYLEFYVLKNTKGITKFIYPFISRLNENAVFLFFLFNIFKNNNNFFQIEELIGYKYFEDFFIRLAIENDQIFKIVNLAGIKNCEFFFSKLGNVFFKVNNLGLQSLYHIFRKEIKIKESIILTRYLKNKTKLLLSVKESIKNNTFEKIIIGCEFNQITYFVKFFKYLMKKKEIKKTFSILFKNYIITDWISNLYFLQFSYLELGYSNFMYRFFQKKNTEFSNLSKIIKPNFKKTFFDIKFFPQKFYNCELELSKLSLLFNSTHNFYLGYISSYLQHNPYLYFSRILINFPDQLSFFNFSENNGLFFDLKNLLYSDNLVLLKIISNLLQQINKSIYCQKETLSENNNFYFKNLTDIDLIFSISFFYTSKYSKKIIKFFLNSIDFYFKSFLIFENNISIWKNSELSMISFTICLFNSSNVLDKLEKNIWKKNFNIIFTFFNKKEIILKKTIAREITDLFNQILNYKKIRIMEIFLASTSLLRDNLISSNSIIFERNIFNFIEKIEIDFFFYFLNKNFFIILSLALGIFCKKSKYKLLTILSYIQNIPEKKIQKLCNLSILIFIFLGTSNVEIIKVIIKQCKKFEKQKLSKLERILLLKSVKVQFMVTTNNLETLNENENEQTFVISKRFLELSIMGISVLTLGDEIGSHMIIRIYGYFLMSSSLEIRRITTLAIGFI
jgi:hypothetical protein